MGPLPAAALLSALPAALVIYALWAARRETLWHLPALAFGALVALAGAGAYGLSKRGSA